MYIFSVLLVTTMITPMFPTLQPRLVDPHWFQTNQWLDDDECLNYLEAEHEREVQSVLDQIDPQYPLHVKEHLQKDAFSYTAHTEVDEISEETDAFFAMTDSELEDEEEEEDEEELYSLSDEEEEEEEEFDTQEKIAQSNVVEHSSRLAEYTLNESTLNEMSSDDGQPCRPMSSGAQSKHRMTPSSNVASNQETTVNKEEEQAEELDTLAEISFMNRTPLDLSFNLSRCQTPISSRRSVASLSNSIQNPRSANSVRTPLTRSTARSNNTVRDMTTPTLFSARVESVHERATAAMLLQRSSLRRLSTHLLLNSGSGNRIGERRLQFGDEEAAASGSSQTSVETVSSTPLSAKERDLLVEMATLRLRDVLDTCSPSAVNSQTPPDSVLSSSAKHPRPVLTTVEPSSSPRLHSSATISTVCRPLTRFSFTPTRVASSPRT